MEKCLNVLFMMIGIRQLKFIKIVFIATFVAYGGDTIRFVEKLFNLPFKEAMHKINIDFNMGLSNKNIDYDKLMELKSIQNEKKIKREKMLKTYSDLCDLKHYYEKIIYYFSKKINIKNWEILTEVISFFETKVFQIEDELIYIDNKLSSRT